MNKNIIEKLALELKIKVNQVEATLKLLSEGSTIPFIARYRKEVTNNLDEEQIRSIDENYQYQVNLLKRKEDVIRLIEEKDLMTDELKEKILKAIKLVEVEDLYRPFKEKKKTKATEAIVNGLEPLAKIIMSFPKTGDINTVANPYINGNVKTCDDAIIGAKYIIAEWISDNASYRKYIRNYVFNNGIINSKVKKAVVDDNKTYEMYYDFQEKIATVKPHRILALNRGETEKILTISLIIDNTKIINYLEDKTIKDNTSFSYEIVLDAIKDSYKRLIAPSIEREIRSELTSISEKKAIEVFMDNLEHLLLTPPIKEKVVIGFDPAYRTGCKLAVLDKAGNVLEIAVIYPHEPRCEKEQSKLKLLELIDKHNVNVIAIGNGTASRESEAFVADVIKKRDEVSFIIVNEAGASVYSASNLAIKEFPNLHVEERSAISIGRRLQDPLSELVKIDPKSIGVGQYQHDVSQKELTEALDFTVIKTVNSVGVNINTASASILKYISGLTKKVIDAILDYRNEIGKINSRDEIKEIKGISSKAYEQMIGFLRITDGINILDQTSIHPESYDITLKFLSLLNLDINDIGEDKLTNKLNNINIDEYKRMLNIDYTLDDIIKSLKEPLRDPRDSLDKPLLKSDILKLEDLKIGMKLQGVVRNVVDFGVFIDIGLKNDGMVHISKLTDKYVKHPKEILSVGQIVDCYVSDILTDKQKVSLSLIELK